jgi:hypothetical protein
MLSIAISVDYFRYYVFLQPFTRYCNLIFSPDVGRKVRYSSCFVESLIPNSCVHA